MTLILWLEIYYFFGTKFSWNEGIDIFFNVKCVLLGCNFDFLGGYLVVTAHYPVVTGGSCSLLLVLTFRMNALNLVQHFEHFFEHFFLFTVVLNINNVSSCYNQNRITKSTYIVFVAKDLGQMLNSRMKLKVRFKNSSEKKFINSNMACCSD